MFTLKWGKHTNSFSSSIWSLKKIILIFLERCYTTEVANTYFVFSLSGHYFTTLQNILYFKIMTIFSLPLTERAKYSFFISCKTGFLSDNFHSLKSQRPSRLWIIFSKNLSWLGRHFRSLEKNSWTFSLWNGLCCTFYLKPQINYVCIYMMSPLNNWVWNTAYLFRLVNLVRRLHHFVQLINNYWMRLSMLSRII